MLAQNDRLFKTGVKLSVAKCCLPYRGAGHPSSWILLGKYSPLNHTTQLSISCIAETHLKWDELVVTSLEDATGACASAAKVHHNCSSRPTSNPDTKTLITFITLSYKNTCFGCNSLGSPLISGCLGGSICKAEMMQ